MLYLYDDAIVDDLKESFDEQYSSIFVKAVEPASAIPIAAQLQDDDISFPLLCVVRNPEYSIDSELTNFTAMNRGVATVFDKDNNLIYKEKSIPITLDYSITVVSTNTADVDELTRELIFKYRSMYFCEISLPYESTRKLRFGLELVNDATIERNSGYVDMLSDGQLYETQIPLSTRGCRLLSYTPVKLRNVQYEIGAYDKSQVDRL